MDNTTTDCCTAKEDKSSDSEFFCLMRVGRNSEWLHLPENTPTSLGRGVVVNYQLSSRTCPLMISRWHCVFYQKEGQWEVVDNQTLNGVWVNGDRIPALEHYQLKLGDTIQLGVPVNGNKAEFEYVLTRRPLEDMKLCQTRQLVKKNGILENLKRKWTVDDVEPSTSKPKLYRCTSADKSSAQPCPPSVKRRRQPKQIQKQESESSGQELDRPPNDTNSACDLDNLQTYSQNILMLREQVDDTQRQVASLEREHGGGDPLRAEQVKELQAQLAILQTEMHRMETFEKSFSESRRLPEEQKTQQQEELLKKQLDKAFQEQKKVIEELAHSQRGFEELLLAKNKELEVTKEEKEKARAQKDEVVTQVTEVLENELQCIICSELLIEAIILNCAHSFCSFCISQWRKKKDECPICRQIVQSQTRCLALDNCIDGMVENLSTEMKVRRLSLVTERKTKRS